jgi:hypothetical protein
MPYLPVYEVTSIISQLMAYEKSAEGLITSELILHGKTWYAVLWKQILCSFIIVKLVTIEQIV